MGVNPLHKLPVAVQELNDATSQPIDLYDLRSKIVLFGYLLKEAGKLDERMIANLSSIQDGLAGPIIPEYRDMYVETYLKAAGFLMGIYQSFYIDE